MTEDEGGGGGGTSGDVAPGETSKEPTPRAMVATYLAGLAAATLLSIASFAVAAGMGSVWTQGIPVALVALAVGQMGVHLVFFLHVTTGPDNTNNVLALAFGTLIVALVMIGSLWIMAHVDHHAMTPEQMMRMQR